MGYVFVSHASEDKGEHVKPLMEALAMQGVKLWIDRPGHGVNHFGFDQDFIERYGIKSLKTGLNWNEQIPAAIHKAGAVLGCLSRHSLCASRQVIVQELLLAKVNNKLVTCIVDENLHYNEIPQDLGLVDASKIQSERINPHLLRQAIDSLYGSGSLEPDKLCADQKKQWEIVRRLVSEINGILDRSGLRYPSDEEISHRVEMLSDFPIGPWVRYHEIPNAVIDIFAKRFDDPATAQRYISLVMEITRKCHSNEITDDQIIVNRGDILNPFFNPIAQYWSDVLSAAGKKSRRTLAAILTAPGAPTPDNLTPEHGKILRDFLSWLRKN